MREVGSFLQLHAMVMSMEPESIVPTWSEGLEGHENLQYTMSKPVQMKKQRLISQKSHERGFKKFHVFFIMLFIAKKFICNFGMKIHD